MVTPSGTAPGNTTAAPSSGAVPGGACATEGEARGSCASADLERCNGGQWVLANCGFCSVITPESKCVDVRAFTLEERGTPEMSNLVRIDNPDMELTMQDEQVQATFFLNPGQVGVLQFEFAAPIDVENLYAGVSSTLVTLEDASGDGCQYTRLGNYTVIRKVEESRDENYNLIVDWHGCWGAYADYARTSQPTTLTRFNARTDEITSAQEVTVSARSIQP